MTDWSPRVLLIDDNPADARLIAELLGDSATLTLQVEAVTDLRSGLQRLTESAFDAVLLDLGSPDDQHLETLRRVVTEAPRMPVVVLTGNRERDVSLEAVGQGAQDYLVKGTFDGVLLTRTVCNAIERVKVRETLRESESRYRMLYERVGAGVFWLDRRGRFTAANPALIKMLGCRSEREVIDLNLAEDLFQEPTDFDVWFAAVRSGGASDSVKLRLKSRHGREVLVVSTTHPSNDLSDKSVGYQGLFADITEVVRLSEQLSYESSHDSLTDLCNRRIFEARVREAIEEAKHGASYALCYMDLDQFKIINETCGHAAGDELLKQLSASLGASVRRNDMLARLGDDEFGLLMKVENVQEAHSEATRFIGNVEQFRFRWGGRSFDIAASAGLVLIDQSAAEVGDIMSAADNACYSAKELGGGRVYVSQTGGETLNRRLGEMQWVMRIKAAVKEDRLLLYQQPIIPVRGQGPTRHFEVLIRKYDRRGKVYLPGAFLPAVERYNLGPMLDRWVVTHVLRWLGEHRAELGPFLCSINLSGRSIGDPRFLNFLENEVRTANVPNEMVCFEITEGSAIGNLSAARALMASLRARGCKFALDDFGSGLSSFGYLRNLDVDYVKLDGLFIKSIMTDSIDRAIVGSITEIAHAMGKETVAEFVEDEAVVPLLRSLGIDYVQGYGLGAPAPIEQLLEPRRRPATHAHASSGL